MPRVRRKELQAVAMSGGQLRLATGLWTEANCCDADCRAIYERHYSRRVYADGRDISRFIGPGEYIALVTPSLDALFVWRKFIDDAVPKQEGVNCAAFRNEGPTLSSLLILEAEGFARSKWGGCACTHTSTRARSAGSATRADASARPDGGPAGGRKAGSSSLKNCNDNLSSPGRRACSTYSRLPDVPSTGSWTLTARAGNI